MTSAAPRPQVNYPMSGQEAGTDQKQQNPLRTEGGDGNGGGNEGGGPSGTSGGQRQAAQQQQQHICVVCGDESDGLHFGQFTCRACAAFFRRTVSLKLQYTCKREHNCEVDKAARNMCRACRYQKCLHQGMLTTAVQHARDGIGKRTKSAQKISTSSSSDTPDIKVPKGAMAGGGMGGSFGGGGPPTFLQPNVAHAAAAPSLIGIQQPISIIHGPAQPFIGYSSNQSPSSLLEQTLLQQLSSSSSSAGPSAFGQLGPVPQQHQQQYASDPSSRVSPYLLSAAAAASQSQSQQPHQSALLSAFTASSAQSQQQPSTSSAALQSELKYLARMLEGYHHFLSLRKASYTLIEGFPLNKRDDEDCPQSNFGTSKKICKIEASLIMDIVEKFFCPFNELPTEDKHKMFDPFYCLFSNAERAYRTYKMFGANDERLLMPDGGYVRLSELQKFYENNTLVRGDPSQVAKIFENAMQYLVKTVVAHMRTIELGEMELMAMFGMFIWNDSEDISAESMQLAQRVRNEIIIDLHLFYRSQGIAEAEITLKTANLFLLIPKLEKSVRLMNDNFCISELFNMLSVSGACKRANRCALIND